MSPDGSPDDLGEPKSWKSLVNLIKGPIYNDQPPQTPGPIYGNPPSYGGPTTPNAAYSPGDRYSQPFRQPTSQSMNGPGSNVAIKKMNPPETPSSALDFQAPTERVLLFDFFSNSVQTSARPGRTKTLSSGSMSSSAADDPVMWRPDSDKYRRTYDFSLYLSKLV